MAEGLPSFIKEDGEQLLFTGKDKEMVIYIPEKYFERRIAEQEGEFFNIIGIFDYTVQDINTGKNIGLKRFRYPTEITTRPYTVEKIKGIKLIKESEEMDYRVLKYREGDIVINSTKTAKFIGNVEKVLNLIFILVCVINTIPYEEIGDYVFEAMDIYGDSFGVNAQVMGFACSEICRDKEDVTRAFRLSGSKNMHDYQSISIKNVSKFNSAYTALISEDFDESIIYAMQNDNPKYTSLEKILVGVDNS